MNVAECPSVELSLAIVELLDEKLFVGYLDEHLLSMSVYKTFYADHRGPR